MKPGNGGRQMTAAGDQSGPGSDAPAGAAARPVLTAGRLTIRPGQPGDAARLRAIRAEPSVARWWGEPDEEPAIEADLAGDGSGVLLVIEVGGQVAGGIQYHEEDDPMFRYAGIDIYLSGSFQGQGAGRQAITLLAGWLLGPRGHHRITIDPAAANEQAIRCYAAAGFRPVGVLRQYESRPDGTFRDGLLMDLLRGELTGS
jgi:aminoglycoside 6'-N-acetyltransferase